MESLQRPNSNGPATSNTLTEGSTFNTNNNGERPGSQNKSGLKRACNECRQQKLRCDVVKVPFTSCSRCRRLSLQCRIDAGFKRVEKRRAKEDQRQQADQAAFQSNGHSPPVSDPRVPSGIIEDQSGTGGGHTLGTSTSYPLPTEPGIPPDLEMQDGSSQVPWAAIPGPRKSTTFPDDIRRRREGYSVPNQQSPFDSGQNQLGQTISRKLDGIELDASIVDVLFGQFFLHYHPYLPFLDPQKSPSHYYQTSRLLFWSVISVASRRFSSDITLLPSLCISVPKLLWTTLQSVPQNHHDVKALCILCTWPFPLSSSSLDPSFMLSGTLMHMAMQIGLHRPRNAQDFVKFKVNFSQEDVDDRVRTWIACNIISQNIATGYGQPSMTMFDWILGPKPIEMIFPHVSKELRHRLRVEKICDRITKGLYCEMGWTVGANSDGGNFGMVKLLGQELDQLGMELSMEGASTLTKLYLCCAQLHLRLYVLIEQPGTEHLIPALLLLYEACRSLLSMVLSPTSTSNDSISGDAILMHCPNYIFQMTLVSAFTILKLLRSSFKEYIDMVSGKTLFNSAILAIRKISVTNNDLPARLAEVLAQLWAKEYITPNEGQEPTPGRNIKQELQLNVIGRMSVSVMFDCLLDWRRGFTSFGSQENNTPAPSSTSQGRSLNFSTTLLQNGAAMPSMAMPQEWNFDAFPYEDAYYPLTWMLDNTEDTMSIPNMSSVAPDTMES